jgi:hypothetical protein
MPRYAIVCGRRDDYEEQEEGDDNDDEVYLCLARLRQDRPPEPRPIEVAL